MGNWAEEQAAQIKAQGRKAEADLRTRIELNQIIQRESRPFFERSGEHMDHNVKEFCKALGIPAALRCSRYENTIRVDKEAFPNKVSLTLTYCAGPIQVESVRVTYNRAFSGVEETSTGTFQFGISHGGQICLESMNPETFAREALQPLIDAFKKPA